MRFNNKNVTLPEPIIFNGLCFTANTAGSTVALINSGGNTPDVKYSTDGFSWSQWDYSAITLTNVGDKVYMKGNNASGFSASSSLYSYFVMTGSIAASGNIMSLIDNGTCNTLTIPATYCFYKLFLNCKALTTPPLLPAMTISDHCYDTMFFRCTNLTTVPELPATDLTNGNYCYCSMFYECTKITTVSILPATILSEHCYQTMFNGCSNLVNIPAELPALTVPVACCNQMFLGCTKITTTPILRATTLNTNGYYKMFNGCTSLNKVTTYATNISASDCLNNWLYNVSSTGDFYNLGGASYPAGTSGIPSGWTVHTSL